jgi:hypothetical protein
MNLKSRLKPITAVAITALAISALTSGCSDAKNLQDAACCSDFKIGTDMSAVNWDVDASIQGSFKTFANVSSDLSAVATASIADVSAACQNIALDLGASAEDQAPLANATGKASLGWCDLAKAQISANFGVNGALAGSISIQATPPKCTASISATADCQASCNVSGSCDIKATPPTCKGGTLTVECSGSCTASGSADVACTGSCSGGCSGSCKASGGVKVDCKGKCDGTCSAGAAGGATEAGTGIQADGSCNGQCDGTCTLDADAPKIECTGVCDGHCDAACKGTADVKVKCDGMCSAEATPLKCDGGTLEGGCMADANCSANCNASANAKAECTPGSVAVVAKAKAGLDAQGELQLQAAIASLEVNLPKLLVVVEARGKDFAASLEAAVAAGGKITTSGKVNASAVVCGVLIGDAIANASGNFAASLSAAGGVATMVGG